MIHLAAGTSGVVIGLGKSGLAAVRYLHSQGLQVRVSEHRPRELISPEEMAVLERCAGDVEFGGHHERFFSGAELVVVSPGVPLDLPVLAAVARRAVPIVGELALAAGRIELPVIGVTGSNGKTTVAGLIGHLLRAAGKKVFLGGNIGTPVLEYLLRPEDFAVMVLELSSFQLESAGAFRPDIGLLLNLSPDHLDRHGGMEAYTAAKKRLFAHQGAADICIIGLDDPLISADPPETRATVHAFGTGRGCRCRVLEDAVLLEPGFSDHGRPERFELAAGRLSSRVNRYNAAAAVLAARCFGVSPESVRRGLADYLPPEHRMTPLGEINGVSFINDSKATNVGAAVAALACFEPDGKKVILIAGGRDKGSDFSLLRPAVQAHVRHLVLIGEAKETLARALEGTAGCDSAEGMADAVALAYAAAAQGDTVLLAPACASFDMFDDYGHRGREFSRCVQELRRRVEAGVEGNPPTDQIRGDR